eukprot:g8720.t1
MSGRGRCSLDPDRIQDRLKLQNAPWVDSDRYTPSYNIGPGGWLPIIRHSEDGTRILQTAKWGLIPSYTKKESKQDSFRMFNARSERLTESPVFKRLLARKHCVVIMNGFYEWKKESSSKKQPYYVHLGEENLVRFAGLYDAWESEKEIIYSTTIITTDSSPKLNWLHGRMPVILPNDKAVDRWLTTQDVDLNELDQLLAPYNGQDLQYHPVTNRMGKLTFQGKDCCIDVRTRGLSAFSDSTEAAGSAMEIDSKSRKVQRKEDEVEDDEEELPRLKRIKVETKVKSDKKRGLSNEKKGSKQRKLEKMIPVKKTTDNKRKGEKIETPKKRKIKREKTEVETKEKIEELETKEKEEVETVQPLRRSKRLMMMSP